MANQIRVQVARPSDAAFQECKLQLRKARRYSAQEQGLAHRLAGSGEMADMVVNEIGRRRPQARTRATPNERSARRPVPGTSPTPGRNRIGRRVQRYRTNSQSGAAGGTLRAIASIGRRIRLAITTTLSPRLFHRVFQLRNRLIGRIHWNHRCRRHPVRERAKLLRDIGIEGAAGRATRIGVGIKRDSQCASGIQHREVQAELVQTLVKQAREQRSGAIDRVRGRKRPPSLLRRAPGAPFVVAE